MGSGSSVLSTRTAAASAVVVATAVAVGLVGPGAAEFLSDEIPRVYDALRALLTPPYLYFIINGIIIFIAASSRFQKAADNGPVASVAPAEYGEVDSVTAAEYETLPESVVVVTGTAEEEEEKELVITRSPKRREYSSNGPEKPLVSARLGQQRRSSNPTPDGTKARGVTLESTWKAITDGRAVPLTRHLKKSDTWVEARGSGRQEEQALVLKSETFNERGRVLRREPSMGQEELNRRVEAFINKFNEEMRLQRQESFQHYLDIINHGGHYH